MVLKLLHRILSPVAKIEVGNIFANYQVVGFKSFMGSTSSLFGKWALHYFLFRYWRRKLFSDIH